jgi:hypothetical protein
MMIAVLIVHGLLAVALLGAITHQCLSALRAKPARTLSFVDRYTGVNQRVFTRAVVMLYGTTTLLGAIIYPSYRLNVRVPFEEMSLGWAVGLFELKEHFGGLGLCLLPFYAWLWQPEQTQSHARDRLAITMILGFIVWWDFLAGHVLNNIRGLP